MSCSWSGIYYSLDRRMIVLAAVASHVPLRIILCGIGLLRTYDGIYVTMYRGHVSYCCDHIYHMCIQGAD